VAVKTEAIGKTYPATTYAVGREKVREYAWAVGETNPLYVDVEAARAAGYADVVAPPMFAVVYAGRSITPALFDPEVGIDFPNMLHAGLRQPARRDRLHRHLAPDRPGGGFVVSLAAGDAIELRVTPDPYVTVRYAGASGDFNPIHIDEEFARSVGLPGRILHGLWTMAQLARAHTEAAGGPEHLKRLSVQFRGMGVIGEEIVVSGTVREVAGETAIVDSKAEQAGTRLIRNGSAQISV
jgi:acyl dehydratase